MVVKRRSAFQDGEWIKNLSACIAEISGDWSEKLVDRAGPFKTESPKSIDFLEVCTWCGGPLSNAL
jgi:hypothetical protein